MSRYIDADLLAEKWKPIAEQECLTGYAVKSCLIELNAQSSVTIPQWVSVKERLPDSFQSAVVFACTESSSTQIGIAEWSGNRWFSTQIYCDQDDIKYWMPLPELPKEDTWTVPDGSRRIT